MNNNKFTSGNEYCIRELFGDNTKIIIPDLQRDYCWGDNAYVVSSDKKPRELVSGFINNIVELYNENINPAKRKATPIKNEKRFSEQKRKAMKIIKAILEIVSPLLLH